MLGAPVRDGVADWSAGANEAVDAPVRPDGAVLLPGRSTRSSPESGQQTGLDKNSPVLQFARMRRKPLSG